MGRREDEDRLWAAVLAGATPRDAGIELGMPWKRITYLCGKWAKQGRYEYGVTIDLGWPTPKGRAT